VDAVVRLRDSVDDRAPSVEVGPGRRAGPVRGACLPPWFVRAPRPHSFDSGRADRRERFGDGGETHTVYFQDEKPVAARLTTLR